MLFYSEGLFNAAFGKMAMSSSLETTGLYGGHGPELAVDGVADQDWAGGSCFLSGSDPYAYWYVELDEALWVTDFILTTQCTFQCK